MPDIVILAPSAMPAPDHGEYLAGLGLLAANRDVSRSYSEVVPDYPDRRYYILRGLNWLGEKRCHVINMSLGYRQAASPTDPIAVAIRRLLAQGISVVVAAGNDGPSDGSLQEFAQIEGVVSVAATDGQQQVLETSSRGVPSVSAPTVSALGTDTSEGDEPFKPGTSFAAPRVARDIGFIRAVFAVAHAYLVYASPAGELPPIELPRLGIADTGIRPDALEAWKAVAYESGFEGDAVTLRPDDRIADWMVRAAASLPGFRETLSDAVRPHVLKQAIQEAAEPIGDAHVAGAGFVDRERVVSLLVQLSPSRLLKVCRATTGADDSEVQALDNELGPLFNREAIAAFETTFDRHTRPFITRVVAG